MSIQNTFKGNIHVMLESSQFKETRQKIPGKHQNEALQPIYLSQQNTYSIDCDCKCY
jgi:hypothetical protein